jgi:hypothetical protein
MRIARSCALVYAALLFGCRERALAQNPPPADAAAGPTVIIELPPPPVDARGIDYAAPLNIDPGAPPGTLGNGKPVPRNTAPDAAPP